MQLKEKLTNKADYEKLCKQACDGLNEGWTTAQNEETVLFAICREVYEFFGEEFVLVPVSGGERLEAYWMNLLKLMSTRQAEEFSVVEITDKYINEALNRRVGKR